MLFSVNVGYHKHCSKYFYPLCHVDSYNVSFRSHQQVNTFLCSVRIKLRWVCLKFFPAFLFMVMSEKLTLSAIEQTLLFFFFFSARSLLKEYFSLFSFPPLHRVMSRSDSFSSSFSCWKGMIFSVGLLLPRNKMVPL
jgi:hypothetical protein